MDNGDGSYTPYFGYSNDGTSAATIAIGNDNKFTSSPPVIIAGTNGRAHVLTRLQSLDPLPSGTLIEASLKEPHDLVAGGQLAGLQEQLDFAGYQISPSASGTLPSPGAIDAYFQLEPSQQFAFGELGAGRVTIDIGLPDADQSEDVIDTSGGDVTGPGGITITIPPNAASGLAVITVNPVGPASLPAETGSDPAFLGALQFDVTGAPLDPLAAYGLDLGTPLAAGQRVIIGRVGASDGGTGLVLTAFGHEDNGRIVIEAEAQACGSGVNVSGNLGRVAINGTVSVAGPTTVTDTLLVSGRLAVSAAVEVPSSGVGRAHWRGYADGQNGSGYNGLWWSASISARAAAPIRCRRRREIMRLQGKAGVITGAGSGIGRASAVLFAREGAAVIVADWKREEGEETVRMILTEGGRAQFSHTDISKEDQVRAMVQASLDRFGRLDFLYNNAAIDGLHQGVENYVPDQTLENWNYMLSINLGGVFLGCKYAIPEMAKRGGGSILSTASIAALRGSTFPVHTYTAAKGAIVALTRALAVAYGPENVRVNVILPGAIRTNMSDNYAHPDVREFMENQAPLRRIGEPEDVAFCALYLASDESHFVTGQMFAVDGGVSVA